MKKNTSLSNSGKPFARINNWEVMYTLTNAPALVGNISGHEHQEEFMSNVQVTSPLIRIDEEAMVAETQNTIYHLLRKKSMNKKNGFALVLDNGSGGYTMSTVHKTEECAMQNGLGGTFGCLNGARVVAVVPIEFEDDGKQNLNYYWGGTGIFQKTKEVVA